MDTLDVAVVEPFRQNIMSIIQKIRLSWNAENVIIKELEDGLTNHIYRCGLPEDMEQTDNIVIKVYGPFPEGYFDREKELLIMRMVSSVGLGAEVYCRFRKGLAYQYFRGACLREHSFKDNRIARAVAKKLACLHQMDIPRVLADLGEEARIGMFSTPLKMSDNIKGVKGVIPDGYDDVTKLRIRNMEFPKTEEAVSIVETLEQRLYSMDFKICLCHGDPIPNNIVHDPSTGEVHLVDWEFSAAQHPPMDIAIYFAGVWLLNDCAEESLKLYPDKEYQLKWIRWYLEYQAEVVGKDSEEVSEDQVIHWYRASIYCALQWAQSLAFIFLMKDAEFDSDQHDFRRARNAQRLFNIIKENHFNKDDF